MAKQPTADASNAHGDAFPGEVRADALYTLDEIQARLKLGQHAMRQARRQGLKVRRIGRRGYVLGEDVLEYVKNLKG